MRLSLHIGLGVAMAASAATTANAELIFGTTQQGFLISFDSASPETINTALPVQGLMSNEHIVGLDFRADDFTLYGYTNFGRTYTVNQDTAQATFLGQVMPFNGSNFGYDWNPVANAFRVVSEADHNCRISIDGNTITDDGAMSYSMGDAGFGTDPNVTGLAYTNSLSDAISTELFVIDAAAGTLGRIEDPNSGQITTVGSLGIDVNARGGFDISGVTGTAFLGAMLADESRTRLYTVNLETGAISEVGIIDGGLELRTMTVVQPIPSPGALALFGLASVMAGCRRRRA
jgi:hypothetical protein